MIEEKNPHSILNYMNTSHLPRKWLGLMLLIASGAVVLFWGVGYGNNLFYTFVLGSSNAGQFEVDPTLSKYIPNKIPLFFKLVSNIYEIPFYHLLFGVLIKGLVLVTYFSLAWKMTGSSFASLIAVFMIFGLFKFEIGVETILNLKLPFVPDSMEFRHWCYLSFRQASAPFVIMGTLFFLSRKFISSSIFLAFAAYCHPHSGIIFFGALNLALMICLLFWEDKLATLGIWVKFFLPFLIVLSPYLQSALSTFRDVDPLPFDLFWELNLKNEPDDASTIYSLRHTHPPYYLSFLLTLAGLFLHFLFKTAVPKIKFNIKNLIQDDKDMLWPMMLAPWTLVGFGYIWESGLMHYLPDFMNDIIASLQIRRANNVSTILYMPIFSVLLSRIILAFSDKLAWEVFGESFLSDLKICLKKINLTTVEHTFAVGLSIVTLLVVLLVKLENIETFKKYWVFDPVGYKHALKDKVPFSPFKGSENIKVSSLVEVCDWIQKDTPANAAIFNPAYIRPFRTCTKRQGFIEEKMDGNSAIVDRKFATIYHKRLADIHKGLSYNDLPGHPVESDDFNFTMRQRYLSLNVDDIEFLKQKYPGYQYFLTEISHILPYEVIYRNENFLLYDLMIKKH